MKILGAVAVFLVVIGLQAWVVMLVLGALSGPLGFTAPGFWVVVGVLWLLRIFAGIFKTNASVRR